jgi:hypothetical protein
MSMLLPELLPAGGPLCGRDPRRAGHGFRPGPCAAMVGNRSTSWFAVSDC